MQVSYFQVSILTCSTYTTILFSLLVLNHCFTDGQAQFVGLFCTVNIHIAEHGENQPIGEISYNLVP